MEKAVPLPSQSPREATWSQRRWLLAQLGLGSASEDREDQEVPGRSGCGLPGSWRTGEAAACSGRGVGFRCGTASPRRRDLGRVTASQHQCAVCKTEITTVPTSWRVGDGICKDGMGLARRKRSIKGGYDSRVLRLPRGCLPWSGEGWKVQVNISG